ncbi:MAG: hypothetical protein IT582_08965 [Opitutaceae bacterium]|nr:hypothetical protein [Opitutaceae bacterium]
MPRVPLLRLMLGVCLGGSLSAAEPTMEVWRKVASYLSKEAQIEFNALPAAAGVAARRERDFCAAVVQLDQQSLSEARLDEVEQRLKALVAAEGNDTIARAARFLLGRMAQLYRANPDVGLAAEYFRGLVEQPGADRWGDAARIKLAVLRAYVLPAVGDAAARVAAVEALLPAAKDPVVVRDLHRVAARAIMFYNLPPAAALRHLVAADALGGLSGTLGADQLVQIGELAWDTGDAALATRYYERLRAEYPRDPRIFLMDQRNAGNPVPHRSEALHGR